MKVIFKLKLEQAAVVAYVLSGGRKFLKKPNTEALSPETPAQSQELKGLRRKAGQNGGGGG